MRYSGVQAFRHSGDRNLCPPAAWEAEARSAWNRRGFTLVELIIVLGILLMAASAAVPAFLRFQQGAQIQLAARRTMALAAEARGLAITRDTGVTLTYDRSAHGLRMTVDPPDLDTENAAAPGAMPAGESLTGDRRLLEYPLDVAVEIVQPDPSLPGELRFRPDGKASEATLSLSREGFEGVTLGLNPRTGRFHVLP